MSEQIDLSGDIAATLADASSRGAPVVVGYVGEDGYPSVSVRGSTHVHSDDQIAIWARRVDRGLATAVAEHPEVSLLYFGPGGPDPYYLSIRGRARVDASANDVVYGNISEAERGHDPERKGVAVIIDVERVRGASTAGAVKMG